MKWMKCNKKKILIVALILFIIVAINDLLITGYLNNRQFIIIGNLSEELIDVYPESEHGILDILKNSNLYQELDENKNVLINYGYSPADFGNSTFILMISGLCFLLCIILFFIIRFYKEQRVLSRIDDITSYLERVNAGNQGSILDPVEDEFSRLQDELYKTVVMLMQTKEAALVEKSNYADNLSNIAHQLKTPITSISLSTQMIKEENGKQYVSQIRRQVDRLSYLEESLLLLARIDAGMLKQKPEVTDIFTLLMMAADELQELFTHAKVSIEIPEIKGVEAYIDMEWTMEAVMNLLKNCMEHSVPGGRVYCSYEKNPLYVQIRIWDEGSGFNVKDLPHLFERFYRGSSQISHGIGIGLSLAKSIIELQNGIIRAFNLTDKGACFVVRFYSH